MTRKIQPLVTVLLTAFLFASAGILKAQSVFWTEDFSTGTQYTVSLGAEGTDGTSDYFQRTDGSSIGKTYTGVNGFFFAGQDIDDSGWSGSASPSQLTWTGINIAGKTNIQFSGDFGEAFDSPGDIDAADYLYLEYRIDGGNWDTLIAFRNDGSQYNTNFMEDTDLDGIGDGLLISDDTMHTFTKSIAATGSLMDLRFSAAVNSGDEDFAIDEFKLSGNGGSTLVTTMSFTPASFTSFSYTEGNGPSAEQMFTVSGSNIQDSIILAAPQNYEISMTSGASFTDSLVVDDTSGSISNVTVYVRLKAGLTAGTYNESITATTTGAANQSINLSGTVISANPVVSLWDEEFAPDLSGIDTVSVIGAQVWEHDTYGNDNNCAKVTGYASGNQNINEDWLMSPTMDLTNYTNVKMVFAEAINYEAGTIADREEVYVSTNYAGDPATASWTELTVSGRSSGSTWSFNEVDTIDLSAYDGNAAVTVAFKYTSTDSTAGTWEVDYAKVFGNSAGGSVTSMNFSSNSLSGFNYTEGNGPSAEQMVTVSGSNIQDSIILAAPQNYEISMTSGASFTDSLVVDDTSGSISNVTVYVRLKAGLTAGTYNESITATTTGAANQSINLSGTVISTNPVVSLWDEEFAPDLSGIDTVSVIGAQVWEHDTYGNDNNCAKVTGYASGNQNINEDWLISPTMDLTNYTNVKMVFAEAINYESGTIADREEVYVSTNYAGDPATASWTELTVSGRSSGSTWSFNEVDTIDLSAYDGNAAVTVAFKYTSTDSTAGTWEVDYAKVFGNSAGGSVTSMNFSSNSLSGFNYIDGNGPSAEQMFSVSGSNIQDSIILAASQNYEISMTSGAAFTDSLVVDDTTGSISNVTVYVRLKAGLAINSYSGSIIASTTGAANQTITLSGSVDPVPNPNVLWDEDFNPDLSGVDTVSVVGEQVWEHAAYGSDSHCAKMAGYAGAAFANEDWLISPVMDFSSNHQYKMAFSEAINFESANIADREEVYVSLDYAGDPSTATWTEITVSGRAPGDSWNFFDVDTIDLSAYAGEPSVTVAFKYTSDSNGAGTWEIDDVIVLKQPIDAEPSSHVAAFVAAASDSTVIDVTWADVNDADGYIIKMNNSGYANITAPVDGTPAQEDLDFTDGTGTVNVTGGIQLFSFDDLDPDTEYYFMIWPYSNSGVNIDYKTDGTVPQDTATTHPNTVGIEKQQNELITQPVVINQTLTFELNTEEEVMVRLFSISGQLIHSQTHQGGNVKVEIPVGHINNRILILNVEGENTRNTYKVAH